MGYTVYAFLGTAASLYPISRAFARARIVPLTDGLAIIPMTSDLYDEVNQMASSPSVMKFELLTEKVERRILSVIGDHKVAYVESEFFGGTGGHAGVLWHNGKRAREEPFDGDSMNRILNSFGVARIGGKDEFDVVGLGKHRHTCDWLS